MVALRALLKFENRLSSQPTLAEETLTLAEEEFEEFIVEDLLKENRESVLKKFFFGGSGQIIEEVGEN